MNKTVLLVLVLFISFVRTYYEPEIMLTVATELINKQISQNLGDIISQAINTADIKDIYFEQKVSGMNVKFNLTKIKLNVDINWHANIFNVKDIHNFVINSKNLNITLNGQLEIKIGLLRRQKGPLKIIVTQLELDTSLKFQENNCEKSVGFNIQITDVFINANAISIKIQGKNFDNFIINQIQKYIKPRIPTLLNNAITQKVNPLIKSYTCNRIEELVPISQQEYVFIVNTTKVPQFNSNLKILTFPIQLAIQNVKTNESNYDVERDAIPENKAFQESENATISFSSNFINSILWLIDDAELLHGTVTNKMLGEDPPILLNTTNLSILMPKMRQHDGWNNKQVFLMIEPSTTYEHLLIRSGRLISVLSLSIKFVINVTGEIVDPVECIKEKGCAIACDLNMTMPLSVALNLQSKLARGLIHSLNFYDISIIHSEIDINLKSLKSIINSIVGSMIPDINSDFAKGMELPDKIWDLLKKFGVIDIKAKLFKDFLAAGLTVKL